MKNTESNTTNKQNWLLTTVIDSKYVFVELNRSSLQKFGSEIHLALDKIPRSEARMAVKKYMDTVPGNEYAGGYGHRIIHGHSIEDIHVVYNEFGSEGVIDWSLELGADHFSPHGLPVPFAEEISDLLNLSKTDTINFLTFNAIDVLAGGISFSGIGRKDSKSLFANAVQRSILYAMIGNPILLISSTMMFSLALISENNNIIRSDLRPVKDRTSVIDRPYRIINKKNQILY